MECYIANGCSSGGLSDRYADAPYSIRLILFQSTILFLRQIFSFSSGVPGFPDIPSLTADPSGCFRIWIAIHVQP
jgi:hypothetical protein